MATLPVLYLRKQAVNDPEAAALLARIDRGANGGSAASDEFDSAVAELRVHPVTRATLDEAHRWAREGIEALSSLPEGPVRKALTKFAQTLVERSN